MQNKIFISAAILLSFQYCASSEIKTVDTTQESHQNNDDFFQEVESIYNYSDSDNDSIFDPTEGKMLEESSFLNEHLVR